MKLVLLHGRAQEGKDPLALRTHWIDALRAGQAGIGRELPLADRDIVFPYYGDALRDATDDEPGQVAGVRFPRRERVEALRCAVLEDCLHGPDLSRALLDGLEELPPGPEPLDPRVMASLSNEWVQRGLSLLDKFSPSASRRSLEVTAADVAVYLDDPAVRDHIELGVAGAFDTCAEEPTVVVAHSFGSVVAYRLLGPGGRITCPIRSLITLGSPLGIGAVRRALHPIAHPPAVASWSNAYDERDVVALHPLDAEHFPVTPSIRNHAGVDNPSDNHHKIEGYLTDPVVARWIAEAVEAGDRAQP